MESTSLAGLNPSGAGAAGALVDGGRGGFAPFIWVLGLVSFLIYGVQVKPLERVWTVIERGASTQQTLLWLVCKYPPIVAPIGAILLVVAGRLGSSLGLPGLFRNPAPPDLLQEKRRRRKKGYLRSRGGATAFWGAFGVTFLTGLVWTAVYYSEVFENLGLLPEEHFQRPPWPGVSGFVWDPGFWSHGELLRFLFWTCLPFWGLFLLAETVPSSTAPGMDRRGEEFLREIFQFASGMVACVLVAIGLAKLAALVDGPAGRVWEHLYPAVSNLPVLLPGGGKFSLLKIGELELHPLADVATAVLASFSMFPIVVLLFYAVFAVAFRRRLSPGLAICMLLSLVILVFSVLAQLSTAGQILFLVVLLSVFVYTNGSRFKYRFPGMGPYYEKGRRVHLRDLEEASHRTAEEIGLLRDETVLTNWHEATGQALPKLILIATTGGAYRASFWTTVVLDELNRCLGANFHRHIRLITGASGGMVGAAYFVSALDRDGLPEGGATELLQEESGLDSLTPVVRQLVLGDLPGAFRPSPHRHDRGVELERQWTTLAKTFPELSDGERAGWRPSLVVSPMVVESGRRLLISNLDLSRLAETKPLEPILITDRSGPEADAARIYSRSAIEFFRIFPEARATFSLQTAVRMSATFPFASPAVNLPTDVPRRVVDAGYYDNYGVDLATSWIYVNQDWIRKHTSGVALIQIRAYPSEQEVLSFFGLPGEDQRGLLTKLQDRLMTSFQGLSSPLAGGLSAREWSMRFRNATQVRVLDDLLNRNRSPRLFETFVFENSTEFAMNWFLSDRDITSMRRIIGADDDAPISSTDGQGGIEADTSRQQPDHPPSQPTQALFRDENLDNKNRLVRWWRAAPVAPPLA
jgi:hypothetical protein